MNDYLNEMAYGLRKIAFKAPEKMMLFSVIGFIVSVPGGILVDIFLPMNNFFVNTLRLFLALILAGSLFFPTYFFTIRAEILQEEGSQRLSFKRIFSPFWRVRIGIVSLVLLMSVYFALGMPRGVYTIMSALLFVCIVSILLFMRKTPEELSNEQLGIPDYRDVLYNDYVNRYKAKAAEKTKGRRKTRDKIKESLLIPTNTDSHEEDKEDKKPEGINDKFKNNLFTTPTENE